MDLSNFDQGDIIEVNFNGDAEFMIYLGYVGTNPYILRATLKNPTNNRHATFMETWITGPKQSHFEQSFPHDSYNQNDISNGHIHIEQTKTNDVIENYGAQKNNFEHVNLPPNSVESIIDRAMFKNTTFMFKMSS